MVLTSTFARPGVWSATRWWVHLLAAAVFLAVVLWPR